ncbi:hypothetical protein EBU71_16955 [bacterium]|nr:hypothetical protein [Candidatus Elulimicrobium humile]
MKIFLIIVALLGIMIFTNPEFSLASSIPPNATLPEAGTIPGGTGLFEGTSLIEAITIIINWALGFVGIFIFGIFLYAGFEYANAGGDDTKVQAATKRMVNAVIGLIITFFAFVASNAVLSFVFQDSVEEDKVKANISNISN